MRHCSAKGYRVYVQKFPCIDYPPWSTMAFYDNVADRCEIRTQLRGVFVALLHRTVQFEHMLQLMSVPAGATAVQWCLVM